MRSWLPPLLKCSCLHVCAAVSWSPSWQADKSEAISGTSLVVQWLRILLPMQGTWVSMPGPGRFHMPLGNKAHAPQLQSLCSRAPGAKKGKHCNDKPTHATRESPCATVKTEHSPKLKSIKKPSASPMVEWAPETGF